ncbi:serine protease inhibitor 42Dd-like [Drosophila kikkawai]|uniref:Serine protease inhibitor 42Dd-like n=1 Tax=Drosophila kikkawai TaxID=30033 RepID=A0A6P4HMZ9_DROKI|nr:neuroserpin-like [Drosophila kikkawai]
MSMKIVCILLLLFGIANEVKSRRFSALQMFGNVINDLPDDNVIICPPAIDLALVQLYLAGGGTTETDLKNSLGFKGPSKGNIFKGNLPSWVSEGNPLIRIASRFYARKGVNISSTYHSEYAKYLNTVIENVDENESWAETINPWVTSQTAKGLEDLIEPHQFEDPKKVFLTNTVNFFAQWKYQFKPIADENFYIPDESRSESVKMMKLEGNLKYSFLYKLDCHVVIIPFDKINLDMLLLFPKTYQGIQKIEEGLKHVDVRTTAVKHLHLSMPQFKFKYSRDMVQTLIDLGVNKTVFTHTNLQELTTSNENFIIDSIMHSAIINFDDKGVKSDFATGVDVIATESRPNPIQRRSALYRGRQKRAAPLKKQPNLSLVLNRPFLFAIMDTKRMYFFGRYSHPGDM